MRTLYIVSGVHSYPRVTLSDRELIDFQTDLIGAIAAKERCTGFFEDRQDTIFAQSGNRILDALQSAPPEGERMLQELEANEIAADEYGVATKFRTLSQVRTAGVPIECLLTEEKFNYHTFFNTQFKQGKIPENLWLTLDHLSRQDQEKAARYACSNSKLSGILTAERDSRIFKTLVAFAQYNNILSIGINHPLSEFNTSKHDFNVYRVNVHTDTPSYATGTLPQRLQDEVKILESRYNALEMGIQFTK